MATGTRHVVVIAARCACAGAEFGIRLAREGPAVWAMTWAFPLRPGAAQREGYAQTAIQGAFAASPSYPGCPSCGHSGIVQCGACARIACWDAESASARCPWCDTAGRVGGSIERLEVGGDA